MLTIGDATKYPKCARLPVNYELLERGYARAIDDLTAKRENAPADEYRGLRKRADEARLGVKRARRVLEDHRRGCDQP